MGGGVGVQGLMGPWVRHWCITKILAFILNLLNQRLSDNIKTYCTSDVVWKQLTFSEYLFTLTISYRTFWGSFNSAYEISSLLLDFLIDRYFYWECIQHFQVSEHFLMQASFIYLFFPRMLISAKHTIPTLSHFKVSNKEVDSRLGILFSTLQITQMWKYVIAWRTINIKYSQWAQWN